MNLQKWMTDNGLTQRVMADRCDCDQATIARACAGKVSRKVALKIAEVTNYQVTPNDIYAQPNPAESEP